VRQESSEHPGTVLAAGLIVWRRTNIGALELLLVHSARWNEWSWPKGKLKKGESSLIAAVREVAEETGIRVEPGVPLPTVRYELPDGRPKEVAYWAGRAHDEGDRTAPPSEIDRVTWLRASEAIERVRPGSRAPAEALLALADDSALDTAPLLVVRHAKARSRARWEGTEATRPLTRTGERQARALAHVLAAWQPTRLLCSPWDRCTETLRPYLAPGTTPQILPLLSEEGLEHDPGRVGALIGELVEAGRGVLVCTHRPVLAEVVAALGRASSVAVRDHLPHRDPWLSPAEVLVAHVGESRPPGGRRRVVAVERHAPRP
jgi:8-oxo-dGTP diphosphatase